MTTLRSGDLPPTATLLHTLKVDPAAPFNRLHTVVYSAAVVALLYRHAATITSLSSLSLLVSDLVLAFMWATAQSFRWAPVRRRDEFPDLLDRRSLPAIDVFVCTADPEKEPPASVASVALSAMVFDYPAEKVSVYVSDDGGSVATLFTFLEAARFARYWIPFCKEKGVERTSPEAYFGSGEGGSDEIKRMYQTMKERVESVTKNGFVDEELLDSDEDRDLFKRWKGFTRRDHPAIIKVLLQSSRDSDIKGNAMPNLVYVSREKRAHSPHHFKAGALNALVRVSSILTDAPVVLTLDCDMQANDPRAPLRALCYLMDPAIAPKLAFVQFPQIYQGINRDDIYANEIRRLFRINARGMDGLRGPNYVGTGCFHSRRSLSNPPSLVVVQLEDRDFGPMRSSESDLKLAHDVASCTYELGTKWGSKIGFRYGSLVEDFYTSYLLHCEGWESVLCDPDRAAFVGDAPKTLTDTLGQCKRWIVGLYEVGLGKQSPLTFGTKHASLLVGLNYAHYAFWGAWCIPLTLYALIPQLALTNQIPLFPKLSDPWFYLYAYLFLAAYAQDLIEFLGTKGTLRRWWNDQRMWMIRGLTAFPSGTLEYALNQMGASVMGFNVTSKVADDKARGSRYDAGLFEFGVPSPFFVALGTVSIVNLVSLIAGVTATWIEEGAFDRTTVQLFLSGFVVVNCWPVYEAMFVRRDGGRMPTSVTAISVLISGVLHWIAYLLYSA